MQPPQAVIFDIGNVILQWDPLVLWTKITASETRARQVMKDVEFDSFNLALDAGALWKELYPKLVEKYPLYTSEIAQYWQQWQNAVPGMVPGSEKILAWLSSERVPLYALTNFSREKFAETNKRFEFFNYFEKIIVSGHEGMVKPDKRLFHHTIDTLGINPGQCLFIDDSYINIVTAGEVGFQVHHFTNACRLKSHLKQIFGKEIN